MKNLMKYASLLMAAVMLFSCQGTIDPEQGGVNPDDPTVKPTPDNPKPEDLTLKISSDRNLVQTNVDVATITVTLGEEVITEDVTFYDTDFNVIEIPDFKFIAKKDGDHVIWANYGTYESDEITIKAIDVPIPETPADPNPGSTDFKARVLLTEFTTVGCSACPAMKKILHSLENDEAMAEKVLFTECHSGLVGGVADPCYIHDNAYEEWSMITGFPTVKFDLDKTLKNRDEIRTAINQLYESKVGNAPGIAVNSSLENEQVIAKVTIKAAVENSYRVGAFLLEDDIYAVQTNADADYMHIHNNVIRYIDAKYKSSFYGMPVADLEPGKTADAAFVWDLNDIWASGTGNGQAAINGGIDWPERNNNNLHMVVFVSMPDGEGGYVVVNAIDCPINGMTPYEYR